MRKWFSSFSAWVQILLLAFLVIVVAVKFARLFMGTEAKAHRQWEARNERLKYTITYPESDEEILYRDEFRKSDSILNLFKFQDAPNYFREGDFGFSFFPFRLYSATECFACDSLNHDWGTIPEGDRTNYYFAAFDGFELKNNKSFFRDNNTNYIINNSFSYATHITSHSLTNRETDSIKIYRSYQRPAGIHSVRFRYDYWNKRILIPINNKTFRTLRVVYLILGFSLTLYAIGLLLIVPYRIVRNISMGRAFDLKTIKLVDFLAYHFLLYPFIYFILQLIMKGVLRKYITPDVSFTGITELLDKGWIIYIGLFLFALGVALKRGYNLQREQDLTV